MKNIEFTDHEAHLIHEVFSTIAGPLSVEIREMADAVGLVKQIGNDNYLELLDSIFRKTAE